MKRRSILTLTGGSALGVVLPAMGQPERVAHVGQLGNRPASEPNNVAFHKVVADLMKLMGWEMGRNLVWHYKSGLTNLRQQITNAKELVAEKVDVILASNSEATAAAFEVTKSIPIVMLGAAAVELGYAKSLARPGGNITGMVYQSLDFSGKELELLLALQPSLKKIGFSESLELPEVGMYFKNWQNFAAANGVTMVLLPNVLTLTDIEPLLAAAKREGVQALVIGHQPEDRQGDWAEDSAVGVATGDPGARLNLVQPQPSAITIS